MNTRDRLIFFSISLLIFTSISCSRDDMEVEEIIATEFPLDVRKLSVSGTISDFSGSPINEANISLFSGGEKTYGTLSDLAGGFEIELLQKDSLSRFVMRIVKDGFEEIAQVVDANDMSNIRMPEINCALENAAQNAVYNKEEFLYAEWFSISGRVFTDDELAATNTRVWISGNDGDKSYFVVAVVDPEGHWETIVPSEFPLNIALNEYSGCTTSSPESIGVINEDTVLPDIFDGEVLSPSYVKLKMRQCDGSLPDNSIDDHIVGRLDWYKGDYSFGGLEINREDASLDYCNDDCTENLTSYRLFLFDRKNKKFHFEQRELTQNFNVDFGEIRICEEDKSEVNVMVNGQPLIIDKFIHLSINPGDYYYINEERHIGVSNYSIIGFYDNTFEFGKIVDVSRESYNIIQGQFGKDDKINDTYSLGNFEGQFIMGDEAVDGYIEIHISGTLEDVESNDLDIHNKSVLVEGTIKIPINIYYN